MMHRCMTCLYHPSADGGRSLAVVAVASIDRIQTVGHRRHAFIPDLEQWRNRCMHHPGRLITLWLTEPYVEECGNKFCCTTASRLRAEN